MKCYLRMASLALEEPKDSPFYGDFDGVIVEGNHGRELTREDGWFPAKLTPNGEAIMACPKGEEGEDREDWKELCERSHNRGNQLQFCIV